MRAAITMRLLTVVAVCFMCVPAVLKGASLVHFASTALRVTGEPGSLEALRGWRDTGGVSAAARDPALLPPVGFTPETLTRQRDALKEFLTVKPLSPVRWLALTDAELSLGEPIETAVRAYEMSELTGPYEGYVMPRRAIVGLLLWEKLGPDFRIGVARDLALAEFSPAQEDLIKGILAAKSADTKYSVRFETLQIEGLQADRLASLGLQ